MKYVDEFRDANAVHHLAELMAREATGPSYRLMEFCGGHTNALSRHGLEALLPSNVTMIHGPGCPVCVLPIARLNTAIDLARDRGVVLCTYGDLMRVPASGGRTLLSAKAEGADIRMVYSSLDAVALAAKLPNREVVFFAIGFETTTPPTAVAVRRAATLGLKNFSVLCNHVLTPAAMRAVMTAGARSTAIQGFVGPGHVSIVIGSESFQDVCTAFQRSIVIAGFEPLDMMQAVLQLIRHINRGTVTIENVYRRAVAPCGNQKAKTLMADVFTVRPTFEWRGLGQISRSALRIASHYGAFDAEERFALRDSPAEDHKACICGDVLRGDKRPRDCRMFASGCTPERPLGACMVSSEGACAAHYHYHRHGESACA